MNQILNFAFIPFLIACAIRYFVAKATGAHPLDVRTFSDIEMYGYAVCICLAVLSIWHLFFRASCDKCGSYAIRYQGNKEYNQVHREKKVQEKDNNGRTVTRHLTVTYAQLRHYYSCNNCPHEWTTLSERPK
jgi:hypothetical protein